jgi:hypothetical protein
MKLLKLKMNPSVGSLASYQFRFLFGYHSFCKFVNNLWCYNDQCQIMDCVMDLQSTILVYAWFFE